MKFMDKRCEQGTKTGNITTILMWATGWRDRDLAGSLARGSRMTGQGGCPGT